LTDIITGKVAFIAVVFEVTAKSKQEDNFIIAFHDNFLQYDL